MKDWIADILYPRKCVFCRTLLHDEELDLCNSCKTQLPVFTDSKIKLSFLAQWTGLWYYKDTVRDSILRFKFRRCRGYAHTYGILLAAKLREPEYSGWDVLSWIPISPLRKWFRGYDQTELIAQVIAEEFHMPLTPILRKVRHTKPQSGMGDISHRRANILGAYVVTDPSLVRGQRILLLDDIITTGATASEAARTLLVAGAKEVKLATVAVASHESKQKLR